VRVYETCQAKHTCCVHRSDPAVSRHAALKSEHEHLKSDYEDLWILYERLKHGNNLEASKLLDRIREEDGIPYLNKNEKTSRWSIRDSQPTRDDAKPASGQERYPSSSAIWSREKAPSCSYPFIESGASYDSESVSYLTGGEVEERHDLPPSPVTSPPHLDRDERQSGGILPQGSQSRSNACWNWARLGCYAGRHRSALEIYPATLNFLNRLFPADTLSSWTSLLIGCMSIALPISTLST
jgi:hypothetical protein